MTIDLKKYAINRPFIQQWYKKNNNYDISKTISLHAAGMHCPCIALAFYLAEDIGYTPELIRIIDILIKTYDYTEIKNQLPGSPYLTFGKKDDIKD